MLGAAVEHAAGGVDHVQLFAGACHAHVAQAPFFFHFEGVVQSSRMRKDRLFHTNHKDHRKFQAFGGVQGHERYGIAVKVGLIDVTHQRDFFQKAS